MDAEELAALLSFIKAAGLAGLLGAVIYAGYRRVYVWKWQYDDCCAHRATAEQRAHDLEQILFDAQLMYRRNQQTHAGVEGC